MPIPFFCIPEHIRISIAEKLDACDFVRLYTSSSNGYNTSRRVKTRFLVSLCDLALESRNENIQLTLYYVGGSQCSFDANVLQKLPIRFKTDGISIEGFLTDDFCSFVIDFLLRTVCSLNILNVENVRCSTESFNRLLEVTNVSHLSCINVIPSEFLKVPALEKVSALGAKGSFNDKDLQRLKKSVLDLKETEITCAGINLVLKEWLCESRELSFLRIGTSNEIHYGDLFRGLSNIKHIGSSNSSEEIFIIRQGNIRSIQITVGMHSIDIMQ